MSSILAVPMKLFGNFSGYRPSCVPGRRKFRRARAFAVLCGLLGSCLAVPAQQTEAGKPVIVQPGAPGKPSKRLPPSTTAKLPPFSPAEVEFMQGMIMHHAQAVEMTALITSHTQNKDLRSLGARINNSQADEIKFMRRWLEARSEPTSMEMAGLHHHSDSDSDSDSAAGLMPGMLTPEQMEALRKSKDEEFDR